LSIEVTLTKVSYNTKKSASSSDFQVIHLSHNGIISHSRVPKRYEKKYITKLKLLPNH